MHTTTRVVVPASMRTSFVVLIVLRARIYYELVLASMISIIFILESTYE